MQIKLSHAEMMQAAVMGVIRNLQNLRDKLNPMYGAGAEADWQLHIEGVLGEYALAKALGVFYNAHEFGSVDVGAWQVRTTSRKAGRLIVHPRDRDDHRFVLITGVNGTYTVRGWIEGREAKSPQYWSDPTGKGRHAFFVPQEALNPAGGLVEDAHQLHHIPPE
jgi:hypothetical protein